MYRKAIYCDPWSNNDITTSKTSVFGSNGGNIHMQKIGVGSGAKQLRIHTLEIDPQGGQGHAWTVEPVEIVGGNIPALT